MLFDNFLFIAPFSKIAVWTICDQGGFRTIFSSELLSQTLLFGRFVAQTRCSRAFEKLHSVDAREWTGDRRRTLKSKCPGILALLRQFASAGARRRRFHFGVRLCVYYWSSGGSMFCFPLPPAPLLINVVYEGRASYLQRRSAQHWRGEGRRSVKALRF